MLVWQKQRLRDARLGDLLGRGGRNAGLESSSRVLFQWSNDWSLRLLVCETGAALSARQHLSKVVMGRFCAEWCPELLLAPPSSPLPAPNPPWKGSACGTAVRSRGFFYPSLTLGEEEARWEAEMAGVPGRVPLIWAKARGLREGNGLVEARPGRSRRQPGFPPATLLCSGGGWAEGVGRATVRGRAGGCGWGPRRPLAPTPA